MQAQNKGLDVYGITEHAPRMKGTCTDFYFHNLKVVPRKHGDLELLLGVELNILDENGTVDLEEPHLGRYGCDDRQPSQTMYSSREAGSIILSA